MQLFSSFLPFKFGNKGPSITKKKYNKKEVKIILMYIHFFKFYLILTVNIFCVLCWSAEKYILI